MSQDQQPERRSMQDALELMRDLRARCEWDRAQTHESLRPYLLEEAHEVDDAIAHGEDSTLRDELGDLFLQVLFHSVVAEERGAFDMQDVAGALIDKMRARHPHLYGDGVRRSWESMKAERKPRASLEEGIPAGLSALHRSHRMQDRAAGAGFDWPDVNGPLDKVREEIDEVSQVIGAGDNDAIEMELGDLLFAVVNLCRKAGVHAALALDKSNRKFVARYAAMEQLARERGLVFNELSLEEQDVLWNDVKRSAG